MKYVVACLLGFVLGGLAAAAYYGNGCKGDCGCTNCDQKPACQPKCLCAHPL